MGVGVDQNEAQLRPRTPFSRPRTFKNEGQKTNPRKDTKKEDEGAKKGPEMRPKNRLKKGSKTDLNIISLSFGSLGLSRAEVLPFRRKRRRNRSRKGGLSYVAENEEKRSGG